MKWLKHISDSLDDPFIQDLIDEFKSDGYLVFFGILEMMAREFDIENPGKVTLSHNFIRRKLRLSWHKISTILQVCDSEGRILVSDNGHKTTLNCPKLKELCDDWTQRQLRSKSEPTPSIEEEEEEEVDKERTFLDTSVEVKLSKILFNLILKNNPKAKEPNYQTWAKHIDLAIRVDGRTPEELERVIRWCQADDFWYSNILSTQKLRKQFDQLWVKMNALQEPKPESKPQLARSPVRDNYVPKPPLTPEEQKRADIEKEKFFKAIEKMGEKKGMK